MLQLISFYLALVSFNLTPYISATGYAAKCCDEGSLRPLVFHLSADDFSDIRGVLDIMLAVENITMAISSTKEWISNVVQLMKAAIDSV